jgi:uncharacterized protein (TIGR02246 family)
VHYSDCRSDRDKEVYFMGKRALTVAVFFLLSGLCMAAENPPPQSDEAAIRKSVDAYVDAYNRGDAAAVASFWSREGEYTNPSGERLKGPNKIRPALEAFFTENKGIQLKVAVFDVQPQSGNRIVEKGIAVVRRPGGETEEVFYAATHVKEDGAWKLLKVEEEISAVPLTTIAQLGQLEWLIGAWVDQDKDAAAETVFQWAKNHSFITGEFRVTVKDRIDIEGTQVIGWDPVAKKIRSWIFDSKGGFGEGEWSRAGDRWTVKVKSALATGHKASSMNIYTYINPNTFTWQSVGREVDGEPLPNIDSVTVVRKEVRAAKTQSAK